MCWACDVHLSSARGTKSTGVFICSKADLESVVQNLESKVLSKYIETSEKPYSEHGSGITWVCVKEVAVNCLHWAEGWTRCPWRFLPTLILEFYYPWWPHSGSTLGKTYWPVGMWVGWKEGMSEGESRRGGPWTLSVPPPPNSAVL